MNNISDEDLISKMRFLMIMRDHHPAKQVGSALADRLEAANKELAEAVHLLRHSDITPWNQKACDEWLSRNGGTDGNF